MESLYDLSRKVVLETLEKKVKETVNQLIPQIPYVERILRTAKGELYGGFLRWIVEHLIELKMKRDITLEDVITYLNQGHDIDIYISTRKKDWESHLRELEEILHEIKAEGGFVQKNFYHYFVNPSDYQDTDNGLKNGSSKVWVKYGDSFFCLDITLSVFSTGRSIIMSDFDVNSLNLWYHNSEQRYILTCGRHYNNIFESILDRDCNIHIMGNHSFQNLKRIYRFKKLLKIGYRPKREQIPNFREYITKTLIECTFSSEEDDIPYVRVSDFTWPKKISETEYSDDTVYEKISVEMVLADPELKNFFQYLGLE